MTLAKYSSASSLSHSHNLSINSVSSIAEPTTPPPPGTSSKLWESNKLNVNLALPRFNLDSHTLPDTSGHVRRYLAESLDKENYGVYQMPPAKIDKDYLALISKVPLSQLSSQIFRLAKDQHGCRFLQKRIDENVVLNAQVRVANFDIIFGQVHPMLYELIIDPFGNYLIQKLIDYCDEENLNLILESLQYNLFLISINQHGTRALQKVIDRMNNNYQLLLLVKGLKPYIIELIKDLNGNHVIQKILNKYSPENCQFIYDSIIQDLLVVATHKHGCCVLQKCLNHVTASQLTAFSNVILLYDNFTRLVNDQFGNYVLQYLVSIDSIEVDCRLYGNFVKFGINDLCNLKFSSNVIEKLMKNCYNNEHKLIEFSDLKFTLILLILKTDVSKLINDPYGNYVIQTLIDILINPNVSYVLNLTSHEPVLLPSLQMLLLDNFQLSSESLQVQIIKIWFQNCKIVSSFGKRIQLKINIILNGITKTSHRKSSNNYQPANSPFPQAGSNQNMNANGEFVSTDHSIPMTNRYHPRSLSLDNLALFAHQNHKLGFAVSNPNAHTMGVQQQTQQPHHYYDGYALNNSKRVSFHDAKSASRVQPDHYDPRYMNFNNEAALANLHISKPTHPKTAVPYPKVNQTVSNFSSNEFSMGVGGMNQKYPVQVPRAPFGQVQDHNGADMMRPNPAKFSTYNSGRLPAFVGHEGHQSGSTPFTIDRNLGLFQS